MKVILKFSAVANNRGLTDYIISQNDKGFFAHELGDLTQWAKVFNTGERKAYQINDRRKYGNQYGKFYKPIPLKTISEAFDKCRANINTNLYHS